ncbi:MAG TPA: hypothetical protein VN324_05055 [Quisquiliibacterium sp.]|nr:hypothetical protein [Quisquiliibacterium sp.]
MDHSERLLRAAAEVASLRAGTAADARLRQWSVALKHWQSARLAATHADMLAEPRHRDAARFFLDDLYGAKDFSQRDAELAHVIPILVRTLPGSALATLADAVELDALSERLDEAMAGRLRRGDENDIDEAAYAQAYRSCSPMADREHQLDLVLSIGRSLDRLVRMPLLGALLSAMAGPARLAGVPEMHDFLVRGFRAFRGIGGASVFLGRVDTRERVILHALYGGQDVGWTRNPAA